MKWIHHDVDQQPLVIDVNKRILHYPKKRFMVRFGGTETNPELYIYFLGDTQECKHSGRLGDREEKEGGRGETE